VGNSGALMVDAGNSPAHASLLLDALASMGQARPSFVVLTHWHWDHVFGISGSGIPIIAQRETTKMLRHMAGLDWNDEALDKRVEEGTEISFIRDMLKAEWPDRAFLRLRPPEISFTDELELDLGGVTCMIKHVGGDHSADSSMVYVAADDVLFLGDCLYEDHHHGPARYTRRKLFPLIKLLMSYNAERYLFGHEPVLMSGAQMAEYAAQLKAIGEEVDRAGADRIGILRAVRSMPGTLPEDERLQIVDAFLAGLDA
jgi:glyoxylase-like metal-dependent hydrolase (beta-lactamase superfamily II)